MPTLMRLFNFRLPVIYNLEYLDVVVEDKILLLIAWQFKRSYKISIPALNRKYRQKESAIIVKLPSRLDVISIYVSSSWRKRKYTIVLKKLPLDKETSQLLIQQFKPFIMPDLTLPEIAIKTLASVVKIPIPKSKQSNVHFRKIHVRPHTEKLLSH